jgi:hypothetical protein
LWHSQETITGQDQAARLLERSAFVEEQGEKKEAGDQAMKAVPPRVPPRNGPAVPAAFGIELCEILNLRNVLNISINIDFDIGGPVTVTETRLVDTSEGEAIKRLIAKYELVPSRKRIATSSTGGFKKSIGDVAEAPADTEG